MRPGKILKRYGRWNAGSVLLCVVFSFIFTPLSWADGIVLLKPYNFSPPTEINEALSFKSVADHTGVYDFEWTNGKHEEISIGRVVRILSVPTPAEYPDLDATTVATISDQLAIIQKIASEFPNLAVSLAPNLQAMQKEVTWFKQGHKKIAGRWITASDYQRQQAAAQSALASAQLEARSAALSAALSASDSDFNRCLAIVAELDKVGSPAPTVTAVLTRWKQLYATAQSIKLDAQRFLNELATRRPPPFNAEIKSASNIIELPADLQKELISIIPRLDSFDQSNVFPSLRSLCAPEISSIYLVRDTDTIAKQIAKSDFAAAARISLASHAYADSRLSNPYSFVHDTYQQCVRSLKSQIDVANSHLHKGQEFQQAQKSSAAINEYEEANKVLNDPAITNTIKELRKQSLGL